MSILRMRNAALSRREKPLVLASVQGGLGCSDVAKQMRRLFGPGGVAARLDEPAAADADGSLASGKDNGDWRCKGR